MSGCFPVLRRSRPPLSREASHNGKEHPSSLWLPALVFLVVRLCLARRDHLRSLTCKSVRSREIACSTGDLFDQKIPALTLHRLFPPGARGKPFSHFALSEAFLSGDGETFLHPRRAAPDKAIGETFQQEENRERVRHAALASTN